MNGLKKSDLYFYSHADFFFIKKICTSSCKFFYLLLWEFFTYSKTKKNTIQNLHSFAKKKFEYGSKNVSNDVGNPLCCLDNFSFIIINTKKKKKKNLLNFNYICCQIDITIKMRAILIDWLVDVHTRFKLAPRTLYLTVNIIDRFLALKSISRQKLQLLGISAMLIASKYEEIYAPETRDFVYITDSAYTREDIFRMEALVCVSLKYDLSSSSLLSILAYNLKKTEIQFDTICLLWYCIELTLLEYFILKYPHDIVVTSSIFLVQKILKKYYNSSNIYVYFEKTTKNTNYDRICEKLIESIILLNQNKKHKLTALKRKYSSKKYGQISLGKFFISFS